MKANRLARGEKSDRKNRLNLTDEQKRQFREIDRQAREEKEKLLTAEQKKIFDDMHRQPNDRGKFQERRPRGKDNYRGTQLTDEQREQFEKIDKKARLEFEKLLTEEQKKQIDKFD